MKKGFSELIFILDMSGSMGHLTKDTIGGFNAMIEKQKEVEGTANVTLVCFDDRYLKPYDNIPIEEVPQLTNDVYYPSGMTALYDAVGRTIDEVGKRLYDTPEEERPEKVIISITTDGHENSSQEYTFDRLKSMIKHQQDVYNWEFIFLGADITAVNHAIDLGISPSFASTWTTSSAGMASHTEGLSKAMSNIRDEAYVKDISNVAYCNAVSAINSIDLNYNYEECTFVSKGEEQK